MKKKILGHLITGLGIGFVATTISLWVFRLDEASGAEVMRHLTTWLAASALYGLISLIYDSSVPFPLSLAIHFSLCAAVTFGACVASGIMDCIKWYEWFIYVLPYFIAIYVIIGIAVTLSTRCDASKINKKMNKQ